MITLNDLLTNAAALKDLLGALADKGVEVQVTIEVGGTTTTPTTPPTTPPTTEKKRFQVKAAFPYDMLAGKWAGVVHCWQTVAGGFTMNSDGPAPEGSISCKLAKGAQTTINTFEAIPPAELPALAKAYDPAVWVPVRLTNMAMRRDGSLGYPYDWNDTQIDINAWWTMPNGDRIGYVHINNVTWVS